MIRILAFVGCLVIIHQLSAQPAKCIEKKVGDLLNIQLQYELAGCVSCDNEWECRFVKIGDHRYRYEEDDQFIHVGGEQLGQMIGVDPLFAYDSIEVLDRYSSCWGWEVSETEGVVLLDTSWYQAKANEWFAVSPWHQVKKEGERYNFRHYRYNSDYTKPMKPSLSKKAAETILDQHPEMKDRLYLDREHICQPFIYHIQIKVNCYRAGKATSIILDFHNRHGEC